VSARYVFTALDYARMCRVSEEVAVEFLEHFETVGVVERRLRGWVVTPRGDRLSRGLAIAAPERARAA
jgi:hypothetical protein